VDCIEISQNESDNECRTWEVTEYSQFLLVLVLILLLLLLLLLLSMLLSSSLIIIKITKSYKNKKNMFNFNVVRPNMIGLYEALMSSREIFQLSHTPTDMYTD
jgi:hypothetical protein